MNSKAEEHYLARFRKVFVYVDEHLDGELSVERLGEVAGFSKFHFHRQFTELFGISVYSYIQLCRLKRASYQLAFREGRKVLDIAMASGYEGPEAFSRAFRKSMGQSPSEFRREPQWAPWLEKYEPLGALRQKFMSPTFHTGQVKIIEFPETRVAVFEHRGDPQRLGESIRRFIDWRKRCQLSPRDSATFNILYDNPADTDPAKFRLDLCVSIRRQVATNDCGIVEKTIPGGRCAVLRHVGADDNLGLVLSYLYKQWLPQSGEEPRDFPPYIQRVSFFPDVPEHASVVDAFLPLS